jgi:hypothetical protein
MNAAIEAKRPSAIMRPPTVSMTPAVNCRAAVARGFVPGQPNSFCVPCIMNISPLTTRRIA